jgi:hypothetical protein
MDLDEPSTDPSARSKPVKRGGDKSGKGSVKATAKGGSPSAAARANQKSQQSTNEASPPDGP